jgi:hypothetical protein
MPGKLHGPGNQHDTLCLITAQSTIGIGFLTKVSFQRLSGFKPVNQALTRGIIGRHITHGNQTHDHEQECP